MEQTDNTADVESETYDTQTRISSGQMRSTEKLRKVWRDGLNRARDPEPHTIHHSSEGKGQQSSALSSSFQPLANVRTELYSFITNNIILCTHL